MAKDFPIRIEILEDTPHIKRLCFGCDREKGLCRSVLFDETTREISFTHVEEGKCISSVTLDVDEMEMVGVFLEYLVPDEAERKAS